MSIGPFNWYFALAWLIRFCHYNVYLGRDEFPTDRQQNPASRAQILANPASLVAVKSRIPSRYFSFSRIPHRILVKSRIPRIPFQTPCFCPTRGLIVACVQLILKKEYSALINSQEKCYWVPYQKAKVKLFPFQFHFKYNEKYKDYKHQQFQLWKERRGIFRITLTCTSSKYSSVFNPFSYFCKPVCILIQVSLKLA